MLEQLRQNSRSFLIWILFIIIIAAFVLTFGTQGEVSFAGSDSAGDYVMVVNDREVSVHSWRYGMNTVRGGTGKVQRSQQVLDALLEREILAQAANEAGFRATDDMAIERIIQGEFLILGQRIDGSAMYFRNGIFDDQMLETQVNAMGLPTLNRFVEEQRLEIEAQNMRDLMLRSVLASPEEAQTRFVYENTRVTADLVQYRPNDYRREMGLTDAQLDTYLAANDAKVRAKYTADEALYKQRGRELRIRQIFLRRTQPKVFDGNEDAAAAGQPEDPAAVEIRTIRQQLIASGDFAAIARERSDDERSKAKGGDLGWRSAENPGLGAQELAAAVKAVEVGGITEVVEIPRGYYLLKVEGEREGDLTYDQVKYEIAERMAVEDYAALAARRDAENALARAKAAVAAGQSLGDLFERQQGPGPRPGINDLPSNVTPEQLQEILRGMQEQGSVTVERPYRPASDSWEQGDAPAAAGDQAPAATATTTETTTATIDLSTPDVSATAGGGQDLPVEPDLVKPKVREVGPFTRDPEGVIRSIGKSQALMSALFDDLSAGELAPQLYEVGESFVIAQLVSRDEPNLADFEENRVERVQNLSFERGFRNLRAWIESRCSALIDAQAIGINTPLMNQLGTENEGDEFSYRPQCANL